MQAQSTTGAAAPLIFINTRAGHYAVAKTLQGWEPASWQTWLTLPEQRLLEVTAGWVFRDDTGEITRIRENLA